MTNFWKSLLIGSTKSQGVTDSSHPPQQDYRLELGPEDTSYQSRSDDRLELGSDGPSYYAHLEHGLELASAGLPSHTDQDHGLEPGSLGLRYHRDPDHGVERTFPGLLFYTDQEHGLELPTLGLPYHTDQDHGIELAPGDLYETTQRDSGLQIPLELFILVTCTGGVLAVDPEFGRFHQVTLFDAMRTAIHAAFEGSQIVFYGADAGEPLLSARWEASADSSIGVHLEGLGFLRAPPGLAPVDFDAEVLSDWERLLAIPVVEFRRLIAVSNAKWLIDGENAPTASGSMSLAPNFELTFFNRNCSLMGVLQALRDETGLAETITIPKSFLFFHNCSVPAYARLYRPLIYTTVGGSDYFFQQMSLLVASLETLGEYSGSYAIISDRSATSISHYLDGIPDSRLSLKEIPFPEISAIVSARRNIIGDEIFSGYYPVLYLDSDIICTSPIEGLLVEALKSDKILMSAEFIGQSVADVGPPDANWFGMSLYDADDTRVQQHRCINSGILSGRSQDVLQEPFRVIEQSWQNYKSKYGEWHRAAYDQPFFSLVLQCLNVVDLVTLEKWVAILRGLEPDEDAATKCLVHFNIGVGLDKTQSMKRFYDRIRGDIPTPDTVPLMNVNEALSDEVE